jgi:hypothetical protein
MMWKPGSSKPMKGLSPSSLTPNKSLSTTTEGGTTPSSSSSADKKRLSGSTMNMRFMKRRKDATINNIFKTKENKEKRKSDAAADASNNQNNNKNNDSSVFQQLKHEEEKVVDMDVNDNNDNNDNNDDDHDSTSSSLDDENFYGQATSVDMYGMEASIIGRRSFRGFNPAVERIWKDSKACLSENSSSDIGNNHKLSDEELLLRYKDSANTSGADSGGRIAIGNLDKKKKKNRR